jgi:hypothetical protein
LGLVQGQAKAGMQNADVYSSAVAAVASHSRA